MPDWPSGGQPRSGLISSLGDLTSRTNNTPGSAAWPAANLALFCPVRIRERSIVYKLACGAGATAGGNVDFGIYDVFGNLIVSTGAQAKTSSAPIVVDIADTVLAAGSYYLAMSVSTTNTIVCMNTALVVVMRMLGILQMASAHPLPTTATFAAVTAATQVPLIAAYTRPF